MPDEIEPMIRLGSTIPPQFLNDQGEWEIVRGAGGAYRMQTQTKVSKSPFFGSSTMTKEFSDVMSYFVISNDGNADLTFTLNDGEGAGDTYKVYAGAVWGDDLPPFSSITITTTVPFQAYGKLAAGTIVVVPTPVDTTPPDNVTNLTTSALTATSLTLTWTASASNDCVGYDIYRGPTLITNVTGTTYNVTGLTQATQYTFTVKAKDTANNVATGTSTTITTSSSVDTTPPANVTNLTTANITQSGLTLNWTASLSNDVASYDVYNGATFLANVMATTYNVNGLTTSTSYTFWVKAKDTSGNAASGTSIGATTSAPPADTTAPSNVTSLTTSALTQTTVTLNWAASTDNIAVTGYDVFNGSTFITTVTGLTYNVTGLTASTQYTFTVKARDAAGNVASGTSTTFTTSAVADTTAPVVTASPSAGTFTSVQSVTLSANETATIYYTTDGSTPTTSSTVYSTPIAVNTTTTLKFFGKDSANNSGTVQTAVYTINTTAYVSSGLVHQYDNLTSQVSVTDDGTYITATGDFTLYMVFKHQPYQNFMEHYELGNPSNSQYRFFETDSGPGYVISSQFWDGTNSGGGVAINGTTNLAALPTSGYIHAAVVRQGTNVKVYVNNVQEGTGTITGTIPTTISRPIKIGASGAQDTKAIYLYSRALNTTELTQNFNTL